MCLVLVIAWMGSLVHNDVRINECTLSTLWQQEKNSLKYFAFSDSSMSGGTFLKQAKSLSKLLTMMMLI